MSLTWFLMNHDCTGIKRIFKFHAPLQKRLWALIYISVDKTNWFAENLFDFGPLFLNRAFWFHLDAQSQRSSFFWKLFQFLDCTHFVVFNSLLENLFFNKIPRDLLKLSDVVPLLANNWWKYRCLLVECNRLPHWFNWLARVYVTFNSSQASDCILR